MAPQVVECHFYDCVTGKYNATLPVSGKQWGSGLNFNYGTFQGTVPVVEPEVRQLDPWDATVTGRSVMVVAAGNTPTEAYMVWQRRRQKSKLGLQLQGQTLLSWFNQRVQASDYTNPPDSGINPSGMPLWNQQPADPTLIAAQLIEDALAAYRFNGVTTGLNILGGLSVLINGAVPNAGAPVTPSANWQAPTYPWPNRQFLASLLGQLVQLGYGIGFDIGLDVQFTNGPRSSIFGTINIDSPRRGRPYAQSQLVIDMDRGLDYDFGEDATKSGSTIHEMSSLGGGVIIDNTFPRVQGWPMLEQIEQHQLLTGTNAAGAQAMLEGIAATDEYLLSYPVTSALITQRLWSPDPALGQFTTGDGARLKYSGDWNFPDGFDDERRIVAWQASAPDVSDSGDNNPSLALTLDLPPANAAMAPAL